MDKPSGILPPSLEQYLIGDKVKDTGKEELGQDAFFKLMVTQLQNQDPFKPLESGEFLGQIAQFGTVNGINQLQVSFESLVTSMQSNQALQASTMVGREVVVASADVTLGADGATPVIATLPGDAAAVQVTYMDQFGQIMRQIDLGPRDAGDLTHVWDGFMDTGEAVPQGDYVVALQATIGGVPQAISTAISARVDSVTLSRSGEPPVLNLHGRGAVDITEVIEIM